MNVYVDAHRDGMALTAAEARVLAAVLNAGPGARLTYRAVADAAAVSVSSCHRILTEGALAGLMYPTGNRAEGKPRRGALRSAWVGRPV